MFVINALINCVLRVILHLDAFIHELLLVDQTVSEISNTGAHEGLSCDYTFAFFLRYDAPRGYTGAIVEDLNQCFRGAQICRRILAGPVTRSVRRSASVEVDRRTGARREALLERLRDVYGEEEYRDQIAVLDTDQLMELADNLKKGVPIATPVFDGARMSDIEGMLERAGLDTSGQVVLVDIGRRGTA